MDGASVGGWVKALDQRGRALGLADNLAKADVYRWSAKGDAAAASAPGFEITEVGKLVDDFDQMMARNVVGLGDFADGKRVVFAGGVHENAEGVVGEEAEAHAE